MKSRLYSPGYIGNLELKNRIVMNAMHTALSDDGKVNPALTEYFRERAEGGTGLIIVGASGIDPVRVNTHNVIGIYDDRFIDGLTQLADVIHSYGSKCFVQLWHPGRYARSREYSGMPAVAPSPVFSRFTGETPEELSEKQILEIITAYGRAAERARKAGFDGVEVTAASGYLPAQFLSPLTNKRTDRYGGELSGRLTFITEVIDSIRSFTGYDFPLTVRMGSSDFMEGGNGPEEARLIAEALEDAGIDALSLTGGWHESRVPQLTMDVPHGILAHYAKKIREKISIPLIMSNRLTPPIAEQLVDQGVIDFAGFSRAHLAEPRLASKAEAGKYASDRPCIGCNQGCMDKIFFSKTIRCLVNPRAGREAEEPMPEKLKEGNALKILVIGAGPAGLEFALTAAERGHHITVWEQGSRPGGQVLLASAVRERSAMSQFIDYLIHECAVNGVQFIYNRKATAESISEAVESEGFDRIVLATGKKEGFTEVKNDGSLEILHGWDVLRNCSVPGSKIIVKGASELGFWTAFHLASKDLITPEQHHFMHLYDTENPFVLEKAMRGSAYTVIVIEEGERIGKELSLSSRWVYTSRAKEMGIQFITSSRVTEVKERSVHVMDAEGNLQVIDTDALIETEAFIRPGHEMAEELKTAGIDVRSIGEVSARGNLMSAVRSAFLAASSIE